MWISVNPQTAEEVAEGAFDNERQVVLRDEGAEDDVGKLLLQSVDAVVGAARAHIGEEIDLSNKIMNEIGMHSS